MVGKFASHLPKNCGAVGVRGHSARREREIAHNERQRGELVSKEMNQTPK